jgi:hypothetical protein
LQNASDTPILCTISLVVIMRQSVSFLPLLPNIPYQCNANCDILPKEISLMTTYTPMVLGALPRFLRALAFPGWFTCRTSTLRRPQHPSSIVPRLPVRLQSVRHSPPPRSFGLAQCSDMRISSSPICQVFLSPFSLPSSHLSDPWLYNQHGPSGGISITVRQRLALYMCASIASVFNVSLS